MRSLSWFMSLKCPGSVWVSWSAVTLYFFLVLLSTNVSSTYSWHTMEQDTRSCSHGSVLTTGSVRTTLEQSQRRAKPPPATTLPDPARSSTLHSRSLPDSTTTTASINTEADLVNTGPASGLRNRFFLWYETGGCLTQRSRAWTRTTWRVLSHSPSVCQFASCQSGCVQSCLHSALLPGMGTCLVSTNES